MPSKSHQVQSNDPTLKRTVILGLFSVLTGQKTTSSNTDLKGDYALHLRFILSSLFSFSHILFFLSDIFVKNNIVFSRDGFCTSGLLK